MKTVSPQIVKHFYEKWYQLQNMAVIAVGDFPDTQSVVDLIKTHFGYKASPPDLPPLPYYPVPLHEETRFSCFVEPEADGSAVMISCKMPADELKTVKDYRDLLAESMFFPALNKRYFKISCKKDPPYFSCYGEVHCLVHPVSAYIMTSSCKEKGTLEALESMLTEGTTAWRADGVNKLKQLLFHFLHNESVIDIEYEAQLHKTLLPHISTYEVSKFSERFSTSSSCVIKTIEPQATATLDDLKALVLKINTLEQDKSLPPWDDENIPEEIVSVKPNPGWTVQQIEHQNIGAFELVLSNGMRVCYKCTDFLDDQFSAPYSRKVYLYKDWGSGKGFPSNQRSPLTSLNRSELKFQISSSVNCSSSSSSFTRIPRHHLQASIKTLAIANMEARVWVPETTTIC
ncbi:unnamed protein product [Cuscuta campestris]|uniref:Peptidase M16 C-terminal domain-containing protein n=1 Tax=Cuscuta campestris TaxID=132261 RepID=A0A484M361_9ASTE|nr:unnamed protein product [Cuscuta campestris]